MKRPDPKPERVRELFDYDPFAGRMIRKENGRTYGRGNPNRHIEVLVDSRPCYEHRLVYIWHHGEIERGHQIDHINGNPQDNRIENLQPLTASENIRKAKNNHGEMDLPLGVYRTKSKKNPFTAQLNYKGRRIRIGVFSCPLEAGIAVMNEEIELMQQEEAS